MTGFVNSIQKFLIASLASMDEDGIRLLCQELKIAGEASKELAVVICTVPVHGDDGVFERESDVLWFVVEYQGGGLAAVLHRAQVLDTAFVLSDAAVAPVQHELYVGLEWI